ncbi:hypothetical protein AB0M56_46805, partial [Amycolatopsis sp. NPDC051372]
QLTEEQRAAALEKAAAARRIRAELKAGRRRRARRARVRDCSAMPSLSVRRRCSRGARPCRWRRWWRWWPWPSRVPVFVGALMASVHGGAAAWHATGGAGAAAGAAASAAGVVLVFSPLSEPLVARLGRVPAPALPQTTADLVRDEPQPPRRAVYARVVRAEQFLTGLLGGAAIAAASSEGVLAADGRTSAIVLLAVLALRFSVQARLYPAVRQRRPLLTAGLRGFAAPAVDQLIAETHSQSPCPR